MKQAEMLDTVLEMLYNRSNKEGDPTDLLAERGVIITHEDASRIAKRLEEERFVEQKKRYGSEIPLVITSQGIEFVEGSSFADKSKPIINHYNTTISNSSNANIFNQSNLNTVTQHYSAEQKQLLDEIKGAVIADKNATDQQRQDVIDCVDDLKDGIDTGKIPKSPIKQLIRLATEITSIGSLVTRLLEMLTLS